MSAVVCAGGRRVRQPADDDRSATGGGVGSRTPRERPGRPETAPRLAQLAAARERWVAAGIDDDQLDLVWSPTGPGPTTFRMTVVDGAVSTVVTVDELGQPGAVVTDPALLAAVPATIEELFERMAVELLRRALDASSHPRLGHPDWISGGTTEISVRADTAGS